jgi:hypothetical protein
MRLLEIALRMTVMQSMSLKLWFLLCRGLSSLCTAVTDAWNAHDGDHCRPCPEMREMW